MECTHAAFLSIVWVGSKNRKDGGKHAETEPCNRQNILRQTYVFFTVMLRKQIWIAYSEKKKRIEFASHVILLLLLQ